MKRLFYFTYGLVAYVVFLFVFLYAIGFIGNFGVPKTIDGVPEVPLLTAIITNMLLLGVFAIQHSVMARPTFKNWWTSYVPKPIERSTYVMLSNILMIALFVLWEPMGGVVWNVTNPIAENLLYSLFGLGWLLVLVASFEINHFDLFGMRQVTLALLNKPYTELKFNTPWLYNYVRHPLYVGWFLAFWATPTMTVTHLLFALVTSAYILVAIKLEERNLLDIHPEYKTYRKQVPMLIPSFSSKKDNNDFDAEPSNV